MANRVIVYIDGFNLYYRMLCSRDAHCAGYKWLNVFALFKDILDDTDHIQCVKYFVAKVGDNSNGQNQRQAKYLEALNTLSPKVKIYKGYMKKRCCTHRTMPPHKVWEEKQTDVNIAVEMMVDVYEDNCDTCVLVSSDTDLEHALCIAHRHKRRVILVQYEGDNVPQRLKRHAHTVKVLKMDIIKYYQFPNPIPNTCITKPKNW